MHKVFSKILFLVTLTAFILPSLASAGGRHPFLPRTHAHATAKDSFSPNDNVSYFGGPVISHAKVHVVYWGQGIAGNMRTMLRDYYNALLKSDYLDNLAEYATNITSVSGQPGTNQQIGRGSLGEEITIVPANASNRITQTDIEKELEYQIAAGALPKPDADTVYMLHFPESIRITISFGQSCSTWLADHEVYNSPNFGSVYYALFPCDTESPGNFSTLTYAISHELAEAITDPNCPLANQPSQFPAAWLSSDGEEISDLCSFEDAKLTAQGKVYSVQPNWLNSLNGCSTQNFTAD